MKYRTLTLCHEDGERLPMLVDQRGLPIIEPNVYAQTQRGWASRTIKKKLRSVGLVHEWADENEIDLAERIASGRLFSETEINGSLISFLKRSHQRRKAQKLVVAAKTFNIIAMNAREYLIWRINTHLVRIPASDPRFLAIEKKRLSARAAIYCLPNCTIRRRQIFVSADCRRRPGFGDASGRHRG